MVRERLELGVIEIRGKLNIDVTPQSPAYIVLFYLLDYNTEFNLTNYQIKWLNSNKYLFMMIWKYGINDSVTLPIIPTYVADWIKLVKIEGVAYIDNANDKNTRVLGSDSSPEFVLYHTIKTNFGPNSKEVVEWSEEHRDEFLLAWTYGYNLEEVKQTPAFSYYTIVNTTGERSSATTGMYETFDAAYKGLENKSNWYRPKGTGDIYEHFFYKNGNGTLSQKKERIYSNP